MSKSFLFFVFGLVSVSLTAQQTPDRIRFEHLTITDGLPENSVTCMLQDHLGFMWLGTQLGLVRYDGTKMVTFQYNADDPFSFMGRRVIKLLEDKNGDIWIGSENLIRFDRVRQRFIKYPDTDSNQNKVSSIVYMSQDKYGFIWVIKDNTEAYILKRFDPGTKKWISYNNDPKNAHQLSGYSIYATGTNASYYRYGFAEDKTGKIWVNTISDNVNILQWLDRKNDKFIPFHPPLNGEMAADFKKIGGIVANKGGELFLTSILGKGFFILNTDNGQIRQYKHDARDVNSLICDTAVTAYPDNFGFVWIPTSKGLDRYDPVKKNFNHYFSKPGDLSTPGIGFLENPLETPNGDIWFICHSGMNYYNHRTNRFLRYESDEKLEDRFWSNIVSSYIDVSGMLWLGSLNYGLIKESRINQFFLIKNKPGNLNSLQYDNVFSIFEAPSQPGIIWFGTKKGLDRYDKSTGRFIHYSHDEHNQNSITKGEVKSITEDRKGRFWVGTGEGLNLMDRKKGSFIHITKDSSTDNSLPDDSIFTIMPVSDGTLWIGTASGINHFDYDHHLFTNYITGVTSYSPELFRLLNHYIVSSPLVAAIRHPAEHVNITVPFNLTEPIEVLVTGMGEITGDGIADWGWIENSAGEKIWDMDLANTVCDGGNGRIRSDVIRLVAGGYRLRYRSDDGYSYGHWNRVPPVHANLWGIQLTKLNEIDREIFNKEVVNRQLNGPAGNRIFCITEDSKRNLWIGSNDGGITKFDPVSGKFISYTDYFKGPSCISGSIIENKIAGNFWAGDYLFGLLLIDSTGQIIKRYNSSNGLTGNAVLGIQKDGKGILWLSADKNLCRFDPETEQFQLYDEKNGLQEARFNINASCRSSDGELYFGGAKGANAFYPDQMVLDTLSPRILLTDLDISGKPATIDKDGQMPIHISVANNIKLSYQQNDLTFHFTSLEFNRGNETRFAYRLSPNDKDWVQSGNIRQARYTSLSPGNYTFTVKAANADGYWNETGTSITILILPPWWKTWLAYAAYGLLIIGAVWGFIYYRSQKLRSENLLLEQKVSLRTNQLNQSLEELKSTQTQLIQSEKMASLGELTAGIAHEIQNPLNFVNNFSEVNKELIEELKAESLKPAVERDVQLEKELLENLIHNEEKISHHGKRADSIVKGMLQHSRTSAGNKELTNINALADEYLRLAYHGIRAKDKTFNASMQTDFDQAVGKVNIIPQDMGRVLLNLYNNAFYAVSEKNKLSVAGYEPTVSVSTKKKNGRLEIRVKDNGNGMPQKVLDKIFQPFFTTKPTGLGTGLGLSMSYDIIKAHGGEVKVDTQEGGFTEFTIQIPAV